MKTQFILVIFASYFISKSFIPFFKKYFLVLPNHRSSHIFPKPQGGGFIFASIGVFSSLMISNIIPLIAFPLSVIGLVDDKFKLSNLLRYFCQTLTVFVLLYFNLFNKILLIENNFLEVTLIIMLIIFGTAIINFVNFMDGIDGLIISNFSLIFLIISILYQPNFLLLAASLIGFIPLNWYPSKIFMGDVGSTFLGAIYVGSIFNGNNIFESIDILIISFPLFADAISCLLRRLHCGHNIFSSHKLHLYQRLTQSGMSHQKVSIIYLIAVLSICLGIFSDQFFLKYIIIFIELIIGFWLDNNIAVPFKNK